MKSLTRWGALFALPILLLGLFASGASAFVAHTAAHTVAPFAFAGGTLDATMPTLADLASRLDPNGNVATVVEILNQYNEMNEDMVYLEANSTTGHKTTIRSGIPGPTWRKLYQGVQPSKSTTVSVTDSFGMLENYSRVDKALADLAPNAAAFRATEDRPIIEGFAQEVAQTLLYGNEKTAAAEFTGLASRFASKTAENGITNIIDAGGSGVDNTSIWLVVWGPESVHGIYPRGSKAGIQVNDKGVFTVQKSDGSMYEAYLTHYRFDIGLTVRDWRYVVRVANIDVSDQNTKANQPNLVDWMTQATERIPSFAVGRAAFYCNRNIREKLRLGILQKISYQLTWDTVEGKRVLMFDGIPVRRVDQILNSETQVT